jgi:hypothetical protein
MRGTGLLILLVVASLPFGRLALAGEDVTAVNSSSGATVDNGSDLKKFYTISATLREQYDDNVFTSHTNTVSSFSTSISPSFLIDLPWENSDFSARYTFGLNYYYNRPGSDTDIMHEVALRLTHKFSDRFNIDMRDQGGYYEQPDIINSVGTVNRAGGYYSNLASIEFAAQWTPLFGTVTSYANNYIDYEDSGIGVTQDSDENIISQDLRFAIVPKVNLIFGGIYDTIDYFHTVRGFSDYTGNAGIDWAALPSITIGLRGGVTEANLDGGGSYTAPYASATVNWQLGERSSLNFNYLHNVVPTDVFTAQGQEADRFGTAFVYNVTPKVTAHLQGSYTHSQYTSQLLTAGPNFHEDVVGLDTGLQYHFNPYLDFEGGYVFTDVSSGIVAREYTRDQFYLGVRGTY